jgi:hypothetical protein
MSEFKLYQINANLELLLDQIHSIAEENEGEIPDDYAEKLDKIYLDKKNKVIDIAKYIKTLKAKSEAIKNEMDILHARYKTYNNYADNLKKYLKMNIPTGSKYEDSAVKLSWRKSESVQVLDINVIPDKYLETKTYAHLLDIKRDIKDGNNIPGVMLMQNNNLVIR